MAIRMSNKTLRVVGFLVYLNFSTNLSKLRKKYQLVLIFRFGGRRNSKAGIGVEVSNFFGQYYQFFLPIL